MHAAPTARGPGSRAAPGPSQETVDLTRREVRRLLTRSAAFRALPPDAQREIARNTVEVASYLAEPDGVRTRAGAGGEPYAFGQAEGDRVDDEGDVPQFEAQAAREGAAVAGALLQAVNFPDFVAGLINGVFHSIVQSSIEQMEAYGRLVADVAKSLNQFRDENVSVNQGRDHLVDSFPDLFEIDIDTGGGFFGDEQPGPRVRLRGGVDEREALGRVRQMPVEGAVDDLSEETIESKLVPAARTQLATSRQQLLATMVMMGINRIVVTDGKIQAKVLYDFSARDNMRFQRSATSFDYGDQYVTTSEGEHEVDSDRGGYTRSKGSDGEWDDERNYGSYYSKGTYKNTAKPVMTLMSATQTAGDAALQTRASLAGVVDINFKSDYFPLEKMADSFQIARIQNAAQPGAGTPPPAGASTTPAATPPAAGAPAAPGAAAPGAGR